MEKPFKIWNADRTMRKSVVANSLNQMIMLGKNKMNISPSAPVRIVLECDGTEIEDEEYFAFMPADTIFQFLQSTERWQPQQSTSRSGSDYDEVDCSGDAGTLSPRLQNLLQKMQADITSVIFLSVNDLETLVNMPSSQLASHLAESEFFAEQIQEACRNRLESFYETQDAMNLLRMYHESQKNSLLVPDSSKKRKTET